MLGTRHAQYDFWAINILFILAVVSCLHSTCSVIVFSLVDMTGWEGTSQETGWEIVFSGTDYCYHV